MIKKLAVISTHPIQYYVPIFRMLEQRGKVNVSVFYTEGEAALNKFDPGFKKHIQWDIPLLDGYRFQWAENQSAEPGSHHFKGIVNPDLINMITAWQPDAILVFGWAYKSHLRVLRHFKGKIPVFFRGDSTLLDELTGYRSLVKRLFLKWVYQHVDCAFYVGANNKAYFKRYGLGDDQLIFAPHAIDNERFYVNQREDARVLREQFGINENDTLILFAGKLEPKKAPELLLSAFIHLKPSHTHLLFAGNGILEEELKHSAGSNPNVHFLDFQNQSLMPALYQAGDLFCLPSTGPNETWGLAVNEAMACGKAILASDKVGCAVDLVEPGKNGYIFKAGDETDLSNKLSALLQDGEQLVAFGERSRDIIKEWTFLQIVEAIECKINK